MSTGTVNVDYPYDHNINKNAKALRYIQSFIDQYVHDALWASYFSQNMSQMYKIALVSS